MRNIIFLLLLLLFSCSKKQEEANHAIQINAVQNAFKEKGIENLMPYLAYGYTIKGIPKGLESIILPSILENFPAPKKFTIEKEAKEKNGTRVFVVFYNAEDIPMKSNFLINEDGMIAELNIIEDAEVTTEN